MTDAEHSKEHLVDILTSFTTAMFVTMEADGTSYARPMTIAKVSDGNQIFLVTSVKSPKVATIVSQPLVSLTLQSTLRFVSLSGHATILYDRSMIESLWSEAWRVWFPEGKGDPDICLIKVDLDKGEYWDMSGTSGAAFLVQAAKSLAMGRPLESSDQQNAKVELAV
jgi:general stress protein 26